MNTEYGRRADRAKAHSPSRRSGAALTEFSAAMVVFVIFFFIPLLDFGVVPVRYGIALGVLNQMNHRVALTRKVSDAYKMLQTETWWSRDLNSCGVYITKQKIAMKIVNKANMETEVILPEPAPMPPKWLPDYNNNKDSFLYYLQLNTDIKILPLMPMSAPFSGLPGLTGPASINITTDAAWENLGRDPDSPTQDFYLNE